MSKNTYLAFFIVLIIKTFSLSAFAFSSMVFSKNNLNLITELLTSSASAEDETPEIISPPSPEVIRRTEFAEGFCTGRENQYVDLGERGMVVCLGDKPQWERTYQQEVAVNTQAGDLAAEEAFAKSACAVDYNVTVKDCNANGDNKIMSASDGLVQGMSMFAASTGSDVACGGLGRGLALLNGAIAGFKVQCSRASSGCVNQCEAELETAKADVARIQVQMSTGVYAPSLAQELAKAQRTEQLAKQYGNVCKREGQKGPQALTNILSIAGLLNQAKQCGAAASGGLAQICAQNPELAACQQIQPANCTDPTVAATSTVCICQANPSDPRCGFKPSGSGQFASETPGGGADGTGAGGGSFSGLSGLGGGIDPYSDVTLGERKAPNYKDQNVRGGGGSGGIPSSGTGSGGGGGGGYAGGGGEDANILRGYHGGRGAGGSAVGSSRERGERAVAGGGTGRAGQANMDLKKFLPGGQMDPRRGLAGITGPDGITGPNTDIWRKVKTRYHSVSGSLMP